MSSQSPFVQKTPLHVLTLLIVKLPLTCLSVILTSISLIKSIISNYKTFVNYMNDRVHPLGKVVFVTAGETELGFLTARKLSRLGYTVFVAYKETDCDNIRDRILDLGQNVRPFQCDVIKYRDVTDAADRIARHCLSPGKCLWAVICIGSFCTKNFLHDDEMRIETYEEMIKINALGSARLAKAFVPLLKSTPGSRLFFVFNISASMNLPSSICYSMSRASETQFGYTLRKELKKVNVFTSIFEPISFSRARQDSLTPSSSQPSSPSNWRSKASPLVPESAPEVKSHREAWKRLPNSSTADPSEKVASELVNAVIQSQAPPFFIPLTD